MEADLAVLADEVKFGSGSPQGTYLDLFGPGFNKSLMETHDLFLSKV